MLSLLRRSLPGDTVLAREAPSRSTASLLSFFLCRKVKLLIDWAKGHNKPCQLRLELGAGDGRLVETGPPALSPKESHTRSGRLPSCVRLSSLTRRRRMFRKILLGGDRIRIGNRPCWTCWDGWRDVGGMLAESTQGVQREAGAEWEG